MRGAEKQKKYCPHCKSRNFRQSQELDGYRCMDCGEGFDIPYISASDMKLFLSYDHEQSTIANKVKSVLEENGYDVWLDSSKIKFGNDWRARITSGLLESDRVISLMSKRAIRENGVCLDELNIAVRLNRAYVYVVLTEKIANEEIPAVLSHNQRLDMSDLNEHVSDWDEKFHEYMAKILEGLQSNDVQTYHLQMKTLSDKLQIIDNMVKETLLTQKTFVGRQWLFDLTDAWLNDPKEKVFVIYGAPGTGKSAFAAELSLVYPQLYGSVFLSWNSYASKNVERFTKLLAYRLAMTLPGYRETLYNFCVGSPFLNELTGQDLFDAIILSPLRNFVKGEHETGFIVIDGLDEASPEVVDLLRRNLHAFPDIIKILITSRDELESATLRDEYVHTCIEGSVENNLQDIRTYLSKTLKLPEGCERISEIVSKSEGSFLYAEMVCDAIASGRMSASDLSGLPAGLNSFYRQDFDRISQEVDFESVRPLLEILCVDTDVPEEILTECLGLTTDELIALYGRLKGVVISTTGHFDPFNMNTEELCPNYLPILRLVHLTRKEWLTDIRRATKYYINVSNGYRALAKHYENHPVQLDDDPNDLKYLNFIISLGKQMEDPQSDENPYLAFVPETMFRFQNGQFIKWYILGGEYDKAERALLDSVKSRRGFGYGLDVNQLLPLWQWADLFPRSASVNALVAKLGDVARFVMQTPSGDPPFWGDVNYFFFLLSKIMDSGRFAPVFLEGIRQLPLALLIQKGSDYYGLNPARAITQQVIACLQKLDKARVPVPADVRERCNILVSLYGADEEEE